MTDISVLIEYAPPGLDVIEPRLMGGRTIWPTELTQARLSDGQAFGGHGRMDVGRSLQGVPSAQAFAHEGGSVAKV